MVKTGVVVLRSPTFWSIVASAAAVGFLLGKVMSSVASVNLESDARPLHIEADSAASTLADALARGNGEAVNVASPAERRLRVAFAVFMTDISSDSWRDAVAILAYSLRRIVPKSRHFVSPIVLAPERMPDATVEELLAMGFVEVIRKPIPVLPHEVKTQFAREHMERVQGHDKRFQFPMAEETIKYWGIALTQFDKVLVIDADVIVFDPMDELFESSADLIGVYDHGLDGKHSTMPPVQGGFLLVRPNLEDFENIKTLTREGDWDGGGWKQSGIGFCYGGVGPDGLLQYYYNKDALNEAKRLQKKNLPESFQSPMLKGSRYLSVEREIYDVVVNERLQEELGPLDPVKVAKVKSVHFTGDCIKPWTCFTSDAPDRWFCKGLLERWWNLRAELEAERGLPASPRGCIEGKYRPLR